MTEQKRNMRTLTLAAIALALVSIGCGGAPTVSDPSAEPEPVESTAADESYADETAGDEALEPEEQETVEAEEEPPATGPGQLRVVNRVGGEESGGRVRVLDASGEVVAEGQSGETFTLEAGTYRVIGEITDSDVLIDKPTRSGGEVVVVAGQEQAVTVDHPRSRVRIRVLRRGRPVARWRLELRPQSDPNAAPITLRPSDQHTPVTPGRYDGTLTFGSQRIEVNGIIFQGGATMDVPINVD